MKKITIFVAAHKPSELKTDDVYTPIHVGRAISKYKDEMADMIGDDTGDNISEKNPFYSEMTAQYWAWKNYCDSEYIGFCHYRRYFYDKITQENIDDYFTDGTDVIVVGPCLRRYSRWEFFKTFVSSEDIAIMQKVILKLYPAYYKTMSQYGFDFIDYPLNMFICRREVFEKYAEWVFSILFECEKYVKLSPYSRQQRLYGYLAEFLMPVFFMYNGYKMKALRYYKTEGNSIEGGLSLHHKAMRFVLRNLVYFQDKKNTLSIDYSVEAGLNSDNIII
jgi:hypothetical protein